jgi:hypothetical protein
MCLVIAILSLSFFFFCFFLIYYRSIYNSSNIIIIIIIINTFITIKLRTWNLSYQWHVQTTSAILYISLDRSKHTHIYYFLNINSPSLYYYYNYYFSSSIFLFPLRFFSISLHVIIIIYKLLFFLIS